MDIQSAISYWFGVNKPASADLYKSVEKKNIFEVKRHIEESLQGKINLDINWANLEDISSTPLHKGCLNGSTEIVQLLLSHKDINVNVKDEFGATPFFNACFKGNLDVVKLLLVDGRVDVNLSNEYGWTPLMRACYNRNVDVVKVLIGDDRVDLTAKLEEDDDGYETLARSTAIDICLQENCPEIAKLIEDEIEKRKQDSNQLEKKIKQLNEELRLKDYTIEKLSSENSLLLTRIGSLESRSLERIDDRGEKADQRIKFMDLWDMELQVDKSWDQIKNLVPYSKSLIIENSQLKIPLESDLIRQIQFLMNRFGSSINDIKKAYAVHNKDLSQSFHSKRRLISMEHRQSPDLFKKKDWKSTTDEKDLLQKYRFHDHLEQICQFYDWNSSQLAKVIPMIHGTTQEAAENICQSGLSIVAETDPGYYGQGMYFTDSIFYASNYSKINSEGYQVYVICFVLPGNSYPVTEVPYLTNSQGKGFVNPDGFVGKPVKPGYQSHFTLVNKTKFEEAFPVTGAIDKNCVSELVVFEKAQVLPLYVIYI